MQCIVNPAGNFPLNDDWQYARPVWSLLNKGTYVATDSYSPILIAQVFWGYLFCFPGGFSFTALRISTMVLSLVCIMVFYALLLKTSKNSKLSFLGALLLCTNPFFLILSDGFMTDVPFLTFAIISIYFFIRSYENNKNSDVIIATCFAILATLIRQFGIVIPIAYCFVAIIKNKPKFISGLKYILPAFITLAALKLGLLWLTHIGSGLTPYKGTDLIDFFKRPKEIYEHTTEWGSYIFLYSGFFLLPVLTLTAINSITQLTRKNKIILFVGTIAFIPLLVIWCQKFLYGNIMHTYGIGPQTLKGMLDIVNPNPDFPVAPLKILQSMAFLGGVMLALNLGSVCINLVKSFREKNLTGKFFVQLFIVLAFLGYALLLFIPDFFFDRYLLPFIPLSALLIIANVGDNIKIKAPVYISGCVIALLIGCAGAAMTHDYFAWNRTRWSATDYLMKDLKISPHNIDGGYEFNGWLLDKNFPPDPKSPNRSWWSVDDDEYIVAFHNFDGYTIFKEYPYQNYLPYETKKIFVLHRITK